mgnify:CR=1 FL=1
MMIDPVTLALSVLGGLLAGGLFFGGLYVTTAHLRRVARPAFLMLGSFMGRAAVVVAGAWLVATAADAWALLGYLVGLTGARLVIVAFVRRAGDSEGV